MLVSLKHLNSYLPDIKLTAEETTNALNEIGFEVEDVRKFANIEGILFAKVINVFKNPNSDRLDVVELKTKKGQITIQTTNRILKVGDLVVCFPVGAKRGEIIFGEKTLKGYPSQGMLASWSELGYKWDLLSKKDELLVLPNDFASINDDPMQLLSIDDYLIEIAINANRNDANSYFILAKELAAYFNTKFVFESKEQEPNFISDFKAANGMAKNLSFSEIKGKLKTSIYEKTLLAKHDISSLFDWSVNLTNLTLINIGVPVHVYNAAKLQKNITAKLYSGEIEILGGKKVAVDNVLAISDDSNIISLASVIGLETTKTDLDTENYLFEVGVFDPKYIRHGIKEIRISTTASSQGSRVITAYLASVAMEFIRFYCKNLQISQIINPIIYHKQPSIIYNAELLKKYAGINEINVFDNALKKLTLLGFRFENDKITTPEYRYDIEVFEDIIEEIFRFYSYAKFKPQPIKTVPAHIQKINNSKSYFQHQGYNEVRTFTLVSKEKNKLNPFSFEKQINLMTFVSKERECIRNSIITSLSEVVAYNQKRKMSNINIFEYGMISENIMVWGLASTTKTFEQLKQDVINFLGFDVKFTALKDNDYIHPNVSAYIKYNNTIIGWIGKIHPKYDQTNAFYAEFMDIKANNKIKYIPVDLSPLKTLDLTFTLKNTDYIGNIVSNLGCHGQIYDIQQIDNYQQTNTRNVTLRISANDEVIQRLNEKFNK
ncbi:phenylalanine--tRNA ligase subunit beta [Mycoplasma sp. 6243]|uniref:phenylalanine--tRNA ligase subunit beta n=1 Tax=Mycoplasma sp. 6243 TaxID=3440865 RepID=UPI003EB69910